MSKIKIFNKNSNADIPFLPERVPSQMVQAELYFWCKLLDIPAFLEYRATRRCKPDLVIVHNGLVILVVEIKNYHNRHIIKSDTFQFKKYKGLGVPFLVVSGFASIPNALKIIKKYYLSALDKKGEQNNKTYKKMLKVFKNKKVSALSSFK